MIFGIIGYGAIGRTHAQVVESLPGAYESGDPLIDESLLRQGKTVR